MDLAPSAPPPAPAQAKAVDEILSTLSYRSRQLRRQLGLTVRALAERSHLSARFLMDVEAGRGNISVRRLADLAAALQTTPAELVTPAATSVPRSVALLGLRGAGKTTVGRHLSRKLRLPLVELDRRVEARAGLKLDEIFTLHGEEYYRRLERDTLVDLLAEGKPMVLAVGGGLVTVPETYSLLRRQMMTVWLRARPEDYWTRVVRQGDRRPMSQHPQAEQALRQLIERREPLYARADVTVDTSALSVSRVVDKIIGDMRT